ncbi:DUF547 domain-containing protein [Dokdonia sp. Dokd-P16]|uniref:DUF547 domain-containing protein n=1 Tax=Dokdonia sp. Dokd-P16 TaxID=2173169 RepID=UPI000D545297|nr:DUF547 domain-containing protein [Dokdonia sp. Dokd-P16]AWH74265.1 DUF547 domain-containing protein [Dokdonia sp. Dokd-P16]
MQKLIYFILAIALITGCSSSKNVTTPAEPEVAMVITESRVEIPQTVITDTEEAESTISEPEEVVEVAVSNNEPEEVVEVIEEVSNFNHDAFDTLLKKYVSKEGNVNYNGIKSNWSSLRAYIASLGQSLPTATWSQEEKLSYWMNAYNAMTIDLILRNYPLESIKDIKDPWDQRFWKLGNKWYNLNEIEHEILRKMGDARIHFGINCASYSCPPLLNEAFTPSEVDAQLEMLSRKFINDPTRNTITSDRVEVSKIFTWFAKDFKTDGSLIDFLNRYSTTSISENAKVRYRDYDWTLNK